MNLSHRHEIRDERIRNGYVPAPPCVIPARVVPDQRKYAKLVRDKTIADRTLAEINNGRKPYDGVSKRIKALLSDGRWRTYGDIFQALEITTKSQTSLARQIMQRLHDQGIVTKERVCGRSITWRIAQ